MKVAYFILLFFCHQLAVSQSVVNGFGQNFDGQQNLYDSLYFEIDTLSNANNSWVVSEPNKKFFNSAYSQPRSIFTSQSTSYPINDTSSFTIYHTAWAGFGNGGNVSEFRFRYVLDCDSSKDFGMLEMSIDRKKTWVNLISDTVNPYGFPVQQDQHYFTGKTGDTSIIWEEISYNFRSFFESNQKMGDTIFIRFSFISDSIADNQDGWMIDDIEIYDGDVGIEEWSFDLFKSIVYPNPARNELSITFENKIEAFYTWTIFDYSGRKVREIENVKQPTSIDISGLSSGLYQYQLYNPELKKQSMGRFVVQ